MLITFFLSPIHAGNCNKTIIGVIVLIKCNSKSFYGVGFNYLSFFLELNSSFPGFNDYHPIIDYY